MTDGAEDFSELDDMFRALKAKPRKGDHGAAARRRRETKRAENDREQFNMRVPGPFKDFADRACKLAGETRPQFTMTAFKERAERLEIPADGCP